MGDRIELQGFQGFRGGLDVNSKQDERVYGRGVVCLCVVLVLYVHTHVQACISVLVFLFLCTAVPLVFVDASLK